VEALPADLPGQFSVDVSGLLEIDSGIHVREIVLPEGVVLVHIDPDELVVKVAALRIVEEEPEVVAEEGEGEAAVGEGETTEEAPAE
jgi:Ribosomal protein TL5, C-terminal domain